MQALKAPTDATRALLHFSSASRPFPKWASIPGVTKQARAPGDILQRSRGLLVWSSWIVGVSGLRVSAWFHAHVPRDARANLHVLSLDPQAKLTRSQTSLRYELLIAGLSPQAWNVLPPPPPARRSGQDRPSLGIRNHLIPSRPHKQSAVLQRDRDCRQAAGSCEPAGCGGAAHGTQSRRHADSRSSSPAISSISVPHLGEDCRLRRARRWCLHERQAFVKLVSFL